jgi:hypothetical protein
MREYQEPARSLTCPGCGIGFSGREESLEGQLAALEECSRLFDELSAYTLTHGGKEFIHQHVVDAYAAQHVGGSPSNIRTAFALIGLYLALEKGNTGRQVQIAHMRLGRFKRQWPKREQPGDLAKLTVADVLNAEPGPARDEMILKWAAAVWASWRHAHDWTRQTVTDLLP